jgi:plastocyanin
MDTPPPGPGSPRLQLGLRLAGAALLAATGAIHLDLYLTGYRQIPTIGWLFLLQVISAFALAAAVLVIRSPLAAAAGAGFAATTLAGYLLSVWIGLFGFKEVRTTAGIVAGVIEVAAFAVLAFLAIAPAPAARADRGGRQVPGLGAAQGRLQALSSGQRVRAGRGVAGLAAVALVVLGVAVAGAGGSAGSPSAGQTAPPPGSGAVLTVIIKNFKFSPATPKVSPGERVEVKNEDPVTHTLSAGPAAKFASAFNTGNVAPGQVRFFTAPKQPGAYPFYCKVHTFMTGMLVVGHSAASAAAAASFRAAVRAHPASYCGRQPAARAVAARRPQAARRARAGRLASGD